MNKVLGKYVYAVECSQILELLGLEYAEAACAVYLFADIRGCIDSKVVERLNLIANKYGLPIIFPLDHPLSKQRADAFTSLDQKVTLIESVGLFDYIKLQINAKYVITDSHRVARESAVLGLQVINLKDTHETR